MVFHCDWCGTPKNRMWMIPPGAGDHSAWVCKECHSCYFDEDCNHDERKTELVT